MASMSMKRWDFNIHTLNYSSHICEHLLHIRNCLLEETQRTNEQLRLKFLALWNLRPHGANIPGSMR